MIVLAESSAALDNQVELGRSTVLPRELLLSYLLEFVVAVGLMIEHSVPQRDQILLVHILSGDIANWVFLVPLGCDEAVLNGSLHTKPPVGSVTLDVEEMSIIDEDLGVSSKLN